MWFNGRALASMYKESPKFNFQHHARNQPTKQISETGIVIYSCNLSVLGADAGGLL